jgi:hypothetical protein
MTADYNPELIDQNVVPKNVGKPINQSCVQSVTLGIYLYRAALLDAKIASR